MFAVPPVVIPPTSSVTIILPVRNEERNVEACIRSLLNQSYADHTVVVVDGGSEDATQAILERLAAASSRLQVMREPPLPPGWIGKCWALETGAAHRTTEWLLFTDADTEHHPGALAATIAYAEALGVDLLSLIAGHKLFSFGERVVLPAIFAIVLEAGGSLGEVNDPGSSVAKASGQFILLRQPVYEAVGGHRAVAGDIVHDYAMARLVKGRGYRIIWADGRRWVTARMYRSLREIWEGCSRFFFWAAQQSLAWVLGHAALSLGLSLGTLCLTALGVFGLITGTPSVESWLGLLLGGLGILWLVARGVHMARALDIPLAYGLLHPVGLTVAAAIMVDSACRMLSGRGVTWKGRHYHRAPVD